MDDRVKRCCAGFYELPVIEMLLGNELHPGGPASTRTLATAALVGRDSRVLDVACGRGESARVIARHFGCNVVGVDYSSKNVSRANELSTDEALQGRVHFVQGDAERLPFDDGSFDVVICECSLCVFPNIEGALEEFRRVLCPGGRVGISDVILYKPVPESVGDLLGHVLCISGALSLEGYCDALVATGYSTIRSRDASSALNDMIARAERRARGIENFMVMEKLEIPEGLNVSPENISAARAFVKAGGVGYALISARTPRDQ